jgi:hypothetical protein
MLVFHYQGEDLRYVPSIEHPKRSGKLPRHCPNYCVTALLTNSPKPLRFQRVVDIAVKIDPSPGNLSILAQFNLAIIYAAASTLFCAVLRILFCAALPALFALFALLLFTLPTLPTLRSISGVDRAMTQQVWAMLPWHSPRKCGAL